MKRITKIRIPKGKHCGKCRFKHCDDASFWCTLFTPVLHVYYTDIPGWTKGIRKPYRCFECRKMYPSGIVFEEKEKKDDRIQPVPMNEICSWSHHVVCGGGN